MESIVFRKVTLSKSTQKQSTLIAKVVIEQYE